MNTLAIDIDADYVKGPCTLHLMSYSDGTPAITLTHEGQRLCKVTTHLPDHVRANYQLSLEDLVIKGWSENAGVDTELVKLGILVDTGRLIPCGYTEAHVMRLSETARRALYSTDHATAHAR